MTPLMRAVLATLIYTEQFDYPLSLPEIWHRLIAQPHLKTPSLLAVKRTITILIKTKQVVSVGEWYQRVGKPSLEQTRRRRSNWSRVKWMEVPDLLWWVRHCPWIEAVAVTGSLAMDNVRSEADDVDFLVVTRPGTLWLTRLYVALIAFLKKKRRSWAKEEPNSWCFNLWLDTQHLAMPNELHTLYGAYEVIQAKWVFDRHQWVQSEFYRQNVWVQTWLPNALPVIRAEVPLRQTAVFVVTRLVDWVAFQVQLAYMRRHMTREKVGVGWAFFHPRDTQKIIVKTFSQTVEKMTIQDEPNGKNP